MKAYFIQDCSSSSDLLTHYANREGCWQKAGKAIKRAIAETGFEAYFPFNFKNLNNKTYFSVERMKKDGRLYAIVTNSAINYIFQIE